MASRTYGQACSVANFLDRLGPRWSLLIVRDLLIGPRRFKQLLEGLPSIGANRLTERLNELRELKIVKKAVDAESNAPVYALTEKGRDLEPVVTAMARWGLQYLREDSGDKLSRPDLLVVAFRAAFRPDFAKGICETYEFRIDDTIFFAAIDDGKLDTGLGTASHPAFVFITDSATFDRIVGRTLDADVARKRGLLEIIGDEDAYARCSALFGG